MYIMTSFLWNVSRLAREELKFCTEYSTCSIHFIACAKFHNDWTVMKSGPGQVKYCVALLERVKATTSGSTEYLSQLEMMPSGSKSLPEPMLT